MFKKLAVALAVAALASSATVVLAGSGAATGINGSMHDINSLSSYTPDKFQRTCVFCHTPHNAQKTDLNVPLWNHANAASVTMATPYTWIAPTNSGINIGDPLIGPSRLCMACHDGVTAVDSHGTAGSDVQGTKAMASSYVDGLNNTANRFITDLTVTHPIGFTWTDAVAARGTEIVDKSLGFITNDVTGNFDSVNRTGMTYSTKTIKDTLYGDYMTCATCHDVHNTVNAKPSAGNSYNYFLYAKEEGSAICLSCHVK